MIVDIHTHFVPESWPDLAARYGGDDWPGIRHTGPGTAMLTVGSHDFRPVHSPLWDADERLAAMDRDGIDVQLLCATPFLFAYQRAPEQAPRLRATVQRCGTGNLRRRFAWVACRHPGACMRSARSRCRTRTSPAAN